MKETMDKVVNGCRKATKGYTISTVIGILLMVIPCVISINFYYLDKQGFLFWAKEIKKKPLQPDLLSTLAACVFYVSLIVRYDFFKKDTIQTIIVSVIQFALNVWALAALLSVIITGNQVQTVVLICAIAFSWFGIRAIAGYSWIVFVFLSTINLVSLNEKMGMTGAVFIMFCFISLLLQVGNTVNIRNFVTEFRGLSYRTRDVIGESTQAAVEDLNEKAAAVTQTVKTMSRMR